MSGAQPRSRPSTPKPVTRGYVSELREAQARATRRAIVSSAADTFLEVGYSAATIPAIADRAGVSRRTVFSSVGGKPALLKLAWDWALVGDDEPVPMVERPAVQAMLGQTDPAELVRMWVAFVTAVVDRSSVLGHVIEVAADVDPDVAALSRTIEQQRLQGVQSFIAHLADIDGLRPGISRARAADWCWAHTSPTFYRILVLQQRWPRRTFQQWLAHSISATVLPPG